MQTTGCAAAGRGPGPASYPADTDRTACADAAHRLADVRHRLDARAQVAASCAAYTRCCSRHCSGEVMRLLQHLRLLCKAAAGPLPVPPTELLVALPPLPPVPPTEEPVADPPAPPAAAAQAGDARACHLHSAICTSGPAALPWTLLLVWCRTLHLVLAGRAGQVCTNLAHREPCATWHSSNAAQAVRCRPQVSLGSSGKAGDLSAPVPPTEPPVADPPAPPAAAAPTGPVSVC